MQGQPHPRGKAFGCCLFIGFPPSKCWTSEYGAGGARERVDKPPTRLETSVHPEPKHVCVQKKNWKKRTRLLLLATIYCATAGNVISRLYAFREPPNWTRRSYDHNEHQLLLTRHFSHAGLSLLRSICPQPVCQPRGAEHARSFTFSPMRLRARLMTATRREHRNVAQENQRPLDDIFPGVSSAPSPQTTYTDPVVKAMTTRG